ncbi:hypothetical protein F5Y19DRAFT_158784 [Xylariaceae sp. FL1651]|nr:hypothetical protein F5Y19DRAFT_158784 [Xylariaceae sp. FL1651]
MLMATSYQLGIPYREDIYLVAAGIIAGTSRTSPEWDRLLHQVFTVWPYPSITAVRIAPAGPDQTVFRHAYFRAIEAVMPMVYLKGLEQVRAESPVILVASNTLGHHPLQDLEALVDNFLGSTALQLRAIDFPDEALQFQAAHGVLLPKIEFVEMILKDYYPKDTLGRSLCIVADLDRCYSYETHNLIRRLVRALESFFVQRCEGKLLFYNGTDFDIRGLVQNRELVRTSGYSPTIIPTIYK